MLNHRCVSEPIRRAVVEIAHQSQGVVGSYCSRLHSCPEQQSPWINGDQVEALIDQHCRPVRPVCRPFLQLKHQGLPQHRTDRQAVTKRLKQFRGAQSRADHHAVVTGAVSFGVMHSPAGAMAFQLNHVR